MAYLSFCAPCVSGLELSDKAEPLNQNKERKPPQK